jgi:hypothetical protein
VVIADLVGEVGHVLIPDVGGQRVDAEQVRVEVVQVGRVVAVDAGVGGPEHDLAGLLVDQPAMLATGLVGQGGSDLVQVEGGQVQHRVSSHMTSA